MRFARALGALAAVSILLLPAAALAAEMRGVTATEIRIGQTMPYSGPVSAFGALGKGEVGYFKMLNDRGGINGRKVNLISLDDSYAPPKTVEQTRRLVESDEVALIFSSIGTAHNTAIAKYLQGKNIPQLFLASGASKFADIAQFPQATVGVQAGSGILSTAYVKDPDDPAWKDDPGVKAWRAFMIKYVPEGDLHDTNYVNAYNSAMVLEAVLNACGDDLSTENILKQAYSIKNLELPMLLPGIKVDTSPSDHVPVDQMQFMRFNGKTWERFGELLTGN